MDRILKQLQPIRYDIQPSYLIRGTKKANVIRRCTSFVHLRADCSFVLCLPLLGVVDGLSIPSFFIRNSNVEG